MLYIIITLIVLYIISSVYSHRFQEMTKTISRGFNNGIPNVQIQQTITPQYVGWMVILNGILLISMCILLWLNFNWWLGVLIPTILFFSIGILESILPFPNRINLLKKILNEAEKNPTDNYSLIRDILIHLQDIQSK